MTRSVPQDFNPSCVCCNGKVCTCSFWRSSMEASESSPWEANGCSSATSVPVKLDTMATIWACSSSRDLPLLVNEPLGDKSRVLVGACASVLACRHVWPSNLFGERLQNVDDGLACSKG